MLDHRHQGHVGVGGHHDGPLVLAGEVVGHVDAGGAVRRADDGHGGRVHQGEAQGGSQHQGEEDAELGRRAEQEQPGIAEQGAEVDHGSDADEEQQGKELAGHPGLKEGLDGPGVHTGQVHQDGPEAHGEQEGRLHLPPDSQVDENAADEEHHPLLPGEAQDIAEQIQEQLHGKKPPFGEYRRKKETFAVQSYRKSLIISGKDGAAPY